MVGDEDARTDILDGIRGVVGGLQQVGGRTRLGNASPLNAPEQIVANVMWILDEVEELHDEADAGWFGEASTSLKDKHTLSCQIEFMLKGNEVARMNQVERDAVLALRAAAPQLRQLGVQKLRVVGAAPSNQKAGQDAFLMNQLGLELVYETDGATGQVII